MLYLSYLLLPNHALTFHQIVCLMLNLIYMKDSRNHEKIADCPINAFCIFIMVDNIFVKFIKFAFENNPSFFAKIVSYDLLVNIDSSKAEKMRINLTVTMDSEGS